MDAKSPVSSARAQLLLVLGLLVALAFIFFHQILTPGQVLFSNDGPVGQLMSECHQLPARFTGCWADLNTVGYRESAAPPDISFFLQWLLKPVWFSKCYVPISLILLGLSAWLFFREQKLAAPACILGGMAAMLHSAFFSVACWGVAAHTLTIATTFLALAALADTTSPRRWLRVPLAGLCVGMGVAEGADVGALCSIFVALFVIYQALIEKGPRAKNIMTGTGRVAVIAVCAALLSASAVSELVSNDIKDISGTKQDATTRADHWNFATQWSLPKREALGIIIPGLFGYRLDSTDGTQYWGAIGRAAEWDDYFAKGSQGTGPADKYVRCSGSGYYPGVLVLILALWTLIQSLRRPSIFDSTQRKWIWFWSTTILVSLLISFGRYAPFYHFLYALPYFSTIRNPIKFLYFLSMAFIALFAFGMDGLWRNFMNNAPAEQKRQRPGRFENGWLIGSVATLVFLSIGWAIYASYAEALEKYLRSVQFDATASQLIAGFSLRQVGLFIGFFVIGALLVNLTLRRVFTNKSAPWAAAIFGVFLALDLGSANSQWIVFFDYRDQNATNPIVDSLREKSYEHRVTLLPVRSPNGATMLEKVYRADWELHQFPFYDIQTLDISQLPRTPEDIAAFNKTFDANVETLIRKWRLTNTRYLFASAEFLKALNSKLDPQRPEFRIAQRFNFVARPGVVNVTKVWDLTAVPQDNGPFAIIEFTGALPRARLYSQWQSVSNSLAALDRIASPTFDSAQTVLITGNAPAPAPTNSVAQDAGTVDFESYAPKQIQLKANAATPAILLLNDRFDPNWKVFVDGRRETLLKCNYLMRGVYLTSGSHTVEFRFAPPTWPLYISLAALAGGVVLVGFTFATPRAQKKNPKPQRAPRKPNYATAGK